MRLHFAFTTRHILTGRGPWLLIARCRDVVEHTNLHEDRKVQKLRVLFGEGTSEEKEWRLTVLRLGLGLALAAHQFTRGRLTPSLSAAEGGISSLSTIFQHQHHLHRKNGSLPRFEIGHSRMFMGWIHMDAFSAD
jgi:hypothetical protein